jgi:hypothetical protein
MPKTKPGGAAPNRPLGNERMQASSKFATETCDRYLGASAVGEGTDRRSRSANGPACLGGPGPCVHNRPALRFVLPGVSEVANARWTKLGQLDRRVR